MVAEPLNSIAKLCSCGRAFDADGWAALRLVGYVGAASGDGSQVLELRNCVCRSTISLEVARPERKAA